MSDCAGQGVVHPAHVPFVVEAQATGIGGARYRRKSGSVAQTVAAQNAEQTTNTETPFVPETLATQTPVQSPPTFTPPAAIASPTILAANITTSECAKASLVSETIIDGTIYKPGEQFTKVWQIQNVSNCVWDTDRKSTRLNSSHGGISRMPSSA